MNAFSLRIAAVCSLFLASLAHAQSKPGFISSSFSITNPTVATTQLESLSVSVSYPVGLAPNSYISVTQLTTDFQGAIAAYPSPQDPLEAILSTALASILKKYPQMTGGLVTGFTLGPSIAGIPTPGGAILVEIGTSGLSGTIGTLRKPAPKL